MGEGEQTTPTTRSLKLKLTRRRAQAARAASSGRQGDIEGALGAFPVARVGGGEGEGGGNDAFERFSSWAGRYHSPPGAIKTQVRSATGATTVLSGAEISPGRLGESHRRGYQDHGGESRQHRMDVTS